MHNHRAEPFENNPATPPNSDQVGIGVAGSASALRILPRAPLELAARTRQACYTTKRNGSLGWEASCCGLASRR